MDNMQASPMGGQEAAEPAETGTELCIKVAADGSMTVYKESGDGQGEQAAQPAADIGAALKMVLDMYKTIGDPGAEKSFGEGFGAQAQPGRPEAMR